jgi:hypothetical protein
MKKILLLFLTFTLSIIFVNSACSGNENSAAFSNRDTASVYICNSSTAYAYHSTDHCRGLNKCSHEVLKISLSDAIKKYHRQACKICE